MVEKSKIDWDKRNIQNAKKRENRKSGKASLNKIIKSRHESWRALPPEERLKIVRSRRGNSEKESNRIRAEIERKKGQTQKEEEKKEVSKEKSERKKERESKKPPEKKRSQR